MVASVIDVGCGLVTKLYLTLCDHTLCSLPHSSVHGISQARTLGLIAISSSKGSSPSRDLTHVSCIIGWILYLLATRKTQISIITWGKFRWLPKAWLLHRRPGYQESSVLSPGQHWMLGKCEQDRKSASPPPPQAQREEEATSVVRAGLQKPEARKSLAGFAYFQGESLPAEEARSEQTGQVGGCGRVRAQGRPVWCRSCCQGSRSAFPISKVTGQCRPGLDVGDWCSLPRLSVACWAQRRWRT